jgi:hypothetical protein
MSLLSESNVTFVQSKSITSGSVVAPYISNPCVPKYLTGSVTGVINADEFAVLTDANNNQLVLPANSILWFCKISGTTTFGGTLQVACTDAGQTTTSNGLVEVEAADVNQGCYAAFNGNLIPKLAAGFNIAAVLMIGDPLPAGEVIHVSLAYLEI